MFEQHYTESFDSLCTLENTVNEFAQAREFFGFVAEKAIEGENVEAPLHSALGFLDYLIEKMDKQFPEVWNSVITKYPARFREND